MTENWFLYPIRLLCPLTTPRFCGRIFYAVVKNHRLYYKRHLWSFCLPIDEATAPHLNAESSPTALPKALNDLNAPTPHLSATSGNRFQKEHSLLQNNRLAPARVQPIIHKENWTCRPILVCRKGISPFHPTATIPQNGRQ